ncbi:phenylpyruvate tautomerase MIF-related protein [Anaerosporobacter faecicola]|uniref:phenylpyruvate tautomerase MIF-related protein n=1 Tax=Anaerosporobacter faecicola TaxID=2718714 RepID=UPI00143A1971|nr:phenylpyruvate tautomerase MIF-related protein [Anaerosporobacter faecicola]
MPFINSKVTVKLDKSTEDLLKEKLGKAIEVIPGKSEAWLMVGFEDEYSLYFKGKRCEKAAFVEIKIFGSAPAASYDSMTEQVCKIYEEVLGIPGNQIYVKYEEVLNWGYDGHNF